MTEAYDFPELHGGGKNRLIPVDPSVVDQLLAGHEGKEATAFYPDWAGDIAQAIFDGLQNRPIPSMENAWIVFGLMRDEFVNQINARNAAMVSTSSTVKPLHRS